MTAPTVAPPVAIDRQPFDARMLAFLEAAVSETPVEEIEQRALLDSAATPAAEPKTRQLVIVTWSGELDKLWPTLILSSTAAASGMKSDVFVTFWGLLPFVRDGVRITGQDWMQKMLAVMQRPGIDHVRTTKLNFLGLGPWMMRRLARRYNVASPRELLEAAQAMGVRFIPCQMTMDMLGIRQDQLIDGMGEPAGAATALELMTQADATLFI
ncbi:MAG TPA: DsrE/DsrF/DrsH-like family protein [Candidatus Limnocylindria bacterium]|nr:DsrE/DsrF/DrsH-like family protein [Candidatus Limnocylindria bacterium]